MSATSSYVLSYAFACGLAALPLDGAAPQRWAQDLPRLSINVEGLIASEALFYVHYQEVFAATEFTALREAGGGVIEDLWFRPDIALGMAWRGTITGLQVTLSTTPRGPNELSPVFEQNLGPDATVVFGPGSWSFEVQVGGPVAPQPFSIHLRLDRPFFYDPSTGNLLLDIHRGGPIVADPALPPTTFFDVWEDPHGPVSEVYSPWTESPRGTPYQAGLVVRMTGTLIPEPTPPLLLLFGGALLAGLRFWTNKTKCT